MKKSHKKYEQVINFFITRYKNGFKMDDDEYTYGEILDYLMTRLAKAENEAEEGKQYKKDIVRRLKCHLIKPSKHIEDIKRDIKSYIMHNETIVNIMQEIDMYEYFKLIDDKSFYRTGDDK